MHNAIVGRQAQLAQRMIAAAKEGRPDTLKFAQQLQRIMEDDTALSNELTQITGITFAPRVDGFGAFYGQKHCEDGQSYLVNVYPPLRLWNGDIAPTEPELSDTDYQLIIGGEIVGSGSSLPDIAGMIKSWQPEGD